jgi:four helix bundle protein
MSTIERFEDLEIWKNARILCKVLYKTIVNESKIKDFELKNQIRRSSGSIMDNVAEGFERGSNKEFIHFLFIAKGSASEVKSQLYRALDSDFISLEKFDGFYKQTDFIAVSVNNFIRYLIHSEIKGKKFKL